MKLGKDARKRGGTGFCRACLFEGPLQLHHAVPIGSQGHLKRKKHKGVRLCAHCHALAHEIWGPGNAWTGPTNRVEFVGLLRDELERRQNGHQSGPPA